MKGRTLSVLLGFLLLFCVECSRHSYPRQARVSQLTGGYLSLDGGAADSSPIVIPYNTEVTITGESDNDYRVLSAGLRGRMSRSQLEFTEKPLITYRYVRAIEGGAVYSDPDGVPVSYLANNDRVVCTGGIMRTVTKPGASFLESWIKITTLSGEMWMQENQLSRDRVQYYFAAIARSGLNLRSEPSLEAPVSGLIPFKESGRVIRRLRQAFRVENRTGSWMEVEFGGRKGWVFSGFTLLGVSPDFSDSFELMTLEYFQSMYSKSSTVEESSPDVVPSGNAREISGYNLFIRKEKKPFDGCSDDERSSALLIDDNSKKQYIFQAEASVSVTQGPLANSLYVMESHCSCCCPHITNRLILLLPGRVLSYPYQPQSQDGAGTCIYGPVYQVNFGQAIRRSPDGRTLYVHLKYPACAIEGPPIDPGMSIIDSEDSVSELFVRMHLSDRNSAPQIDRIFDQGIPDRFKNEWNAAEVFIQK